MAYSMLHPIQQPSNKLDYKQLGPFTIIKRINLVAFKIKLSCHMKIHHVFYISLLEPYYESKILGQVQAPLSCIQINGKEGFEVGEILDSKIKNLVHYFLVH